MAIESETTELRTYKATSTVGTRVLEQLRIRRMPNGHHDPRFALTGGGANWLTIEDSVRVPFTFIIGDDDGFIGITSTSPGFGSPQLRVTDPCPANDWA